MLADFAGMPADPKALPPYTHLYQACEDVSEQHLNALMMTDLMNIATDYKWHAYCRHRVHVRLALYILHFALAAAAAQLPVTASAASSVSRPSHRAGPPVTGLAPQLRRRRSC